MTQWLWYPDPCQKMRWPFRENIKGIYGIRSVVFHPSIKVRPRREQDLTKKPMGTGRDALQVPPKWNVWSSRKLSLVSSEDCHLAQSHRSWRKFLKGWLKLSHGHTVAVLSQIFCSPHFSDQRENWGWKGKGSVLSCFLNRLSVCVSVIHF